MLTPTQIQRMCTNYYVADYEVCTLSVSIRSTADFTLARLLSRLRSSVWWPLASMLTTGMTTCSFPQKRKKWARTNCHYQETFLV